MNTHKHTPAPWHLHKSESNFIIVHSDGENISHVARLFDSTLCEEHGSLSANARLIASAPYLLDALQTLLKISEKELSQSATHDGLKNCEALAKARQAIKEATH